MTRRFAFLLAAAVFLIDQLAKYVIVRVVDLPERLSVPLLPFLSLSWVENRGVSMGLLTAGTDAGRWLLVGMTAAIAFLVIFWMRREQDRPEILALGLVLGGACGNILDRIRLGYVADFIHLHAGRWSFYVFNVADAAISIGVAILLFRAVIRRSDGHTEGTTDA